MTGRNVQDAVKAKGLPWSTAKGASSSAGLPGLELVAPLLSS